METMLLELRHAVRGLMRAPAFTIAAVLTLALGIGANTAIFSVVNAVLLRPLPFADADRLVMVWETDTKSGTAHEPASVPDLADFRQRAGRLTGLAAFAAADLTFQAGDGEPTRLAALGVDHAYLPLLGIRPIVGRTFSADEDLPGATRVVLIGEALWDRAFARDPDIIGRSIRIDDVPSEVVGVLPEGADAGTLQILSRADYGRAFADRGDRARVDVWVPLGPSAAGRPRDTHPIFILGRLAPGADRDAAQQDLAAIAADLERTYPENDARGVNVEPLRHVVLGRVRPTLLVLLAAVTLVLLVACVNVASLLLVRASGREREVTVRLALGADLRRLARQFVVEGAVLSMTGAVLGVLVAIWGLDLLLALAPADVPGIEAVTLDGRVLGATLGVSVLVGLVFGLVPTVHARRRHLQPVLQGAGSAASTREHQRVRSALVVAEVAMAVVLMAGAGLLIRSLWTLERVDAGFDAEGVLKAEFQLPPSRYPQDFAVWPRWDAVQAFSRALRERVEALPGVVAVSVAGSHPLDAGSQSSIAVVGRESEAADWPEPAIRQVDDAYLAATRVALRAGRAIAAADDAAAAPVVVLNEAAVRRFFGDRAALGARIRLWGAERTVVGVIADERMHGLAESAPPAVYLPRAQAPTGGGSLLVRTRTDPAGIAPAVRAIARELDPALPVFGVETLASTVTHSLGQRRFAVTLLGAFAALALLLAAIGVHGVLSYAVAQRHREIGVRLALGADAGAVRALIVGQGARLAALGLAIGVPCALAGARLLRSLLFGVRAADGLTLAGVAITLAVVALAASWLPARRAARLDPIRALRSE